MWAILRVQLQQLMHNPVVMLLMIGMTILFTIAVGADASHRATVYTFSDDQLEESEIQGWLDRLNHSESFGFKLTGAEAARSRVTAGNAQFALRLIPGGDYRIVAAADNPNIQALDQYVRSVFERERILAAAEAAGSPEHRRLVEERLADPALTLSLTEVGSEQGFKYDPQTHFLFGFALFFSIFTVTYSVSAVLEEKRSGIWDRIILSPVSKTSMYTGHLLYSFMAGYMQIAIIFILFRYAFAFPVGDSFGMLLLLIAFYTFAVVSLGMLLAGLVRTPQQLSVLIPIVAVSSAMIGGAYWPIEIVSNPVLLALSNLVPVTYGMEALKGVAYHGHGWLELAQPVSFLLLIGVVCMGIGINLVERRSH